MPYLSSRALIASALLLLAACPGDDGRPEDDGAGPTGTGLGSSTGGGGDEDSGDDSNSGPSPTTLTTGSSGEATGDPETGGSTGEDSVCGDGIVEGSEQCESGVDLCVDCQWEPGNDHACIAPRVLVISFDPGDASDTVFEGDPDHLSACLARDMREATRFRGSADPFVEYRVVESIRVPGQAPQDADGADYGAIYDAHDICGRVDAGEIDEVWLWGDPGGGFPEWVTTGPHYVKEWGTGAPTCARQVSTMGFNYGVETQDDTVRGGRALHSLGHRLEGMLVYYFEGTEDKGQTNGGWYEQWDGQNHRYHDPSPPLETMDTHCGNVHFPPNTVDGYDYNDDAQVESDCMDWSLAGGRGDGRRSTRRRGAAPAAGRRALTTSTCT